MKKTNKKKSKKNNKNKNTYKSLGLDIDVMKKVSVRLPVKDGRIILDRNNEYHRYLMDD